MRINIYVQSKKACAEAAALLDCGATENFMNLKYVQDLGLPIKALDQARPLLNMDRTTNSQGELKYYMDLQVRTGQNT